MILHIMILDKFLPPFIDFVNEHFDASNHKFIFIGKPKYEYGLTPEHEVEWIDYSEIESFKLLHYMYSAQKIILHGLWVNQIDELLFRHSWLLKKCYWVMWGGDFYFPEKQSWVKKQVIKKMGYLVTGTPGDYELAKKWYGAIGKHIKCFTYPSNLYKEYDIKPKSHSIINIQLGNSATDTNNHIEVLEKLLIKYKDKNIKIYVPLSYGDKEYAKIVISEGRKLFGEKFVPLTEFMPLEKYLEFLSRIDIAIFAHKRQQAFGNIITLLGMGKKVYLNKVSTINGVCREFNIKVFSLDEFNIELIDDKTRKLNIENVKKHFSKESLVRSLSYWIN